jgi:16S rRNA (guanine966-N2)-methyltransferase
MPSPPRRSDAPNQVRIIAGRWRRRVLKFPPMPGLRPTPDRVRETLFNWLGQDLSELSTLDLFAGSGALSFESLSRGAERAVAVDISDVAIAALRRNAVVLEATGLEVHRMDALTFLSAETRRFDVIYVDPPFDEQWMSRLWPYLAPRLNAGACLYVEQPRRVEPPAGWLVHSHQTAGCVHYHLLRYEPDSDQPDSTNRRPIK